MEFFGAETIQGSYELCYKTNTEYRNRHELEKYQTDLSPRGS